jgi:hypothetical protein
MSRRLTTLLIAATVCGASCDRSSSERTIAYTADRPIAERLLPGDKHVVVQMKLSEPPSTAAPQSFDQEIERLRRGEIMALVRVTAAAGEIADQGTWIRTRVNADVDRIVRAPANKPWGESIAFTFSGGTAQIGSVVVSTGKYPVFTTGEQYLVSLGTRLGDRSSLMWNGVGFRVDAAGTLQRVAINDGGEQTFPTSLVGRSVVEVIEALAR